MKDLMVIGAGHLGARVATLWRGQFPDVNIYLKTRTFQPQRSEKWKSMGYIPITAGDSDQDVRCPFVVYSVPPTADDASTTYAKDVQDSLNIHWDQSGAFVYTSSGGVYSENDGKIINEESPVTTDNARNNIILDAESKVFEFKNGIVIRLGGMYTLNRGAHNFWMKSGKPEFPSAPNGWINLLHYDDAAGCVVKALLANFSPDVVEKRIYLASDGNPISRKEIVEAASENPAFADFNAPTFTGDPNLVDGKQYDTSALKKLDWKPIYSDFQFFMKEGYKDEKKCELLDWNV